PAGDDRRIVTEQSVAVQLHEIGEDGPQVIERVGTPRMARDLHALHRREIAVDVGAQLGELLLERREVARPVGPPPGAVPGYLPQLLDLPLDLLQRALE